MKRTKTGICLDINLIADWVKRGLIKSESDLVRCIFRISGVEENPYG